MVSYLLFADDSLLLFKANRESAVEVMECLTSTVKTLDNRNMEKSSIHFAKGVSASMRQDIKEVLGVHNEALSEKYLGMPKDVGAATNGAFKYLKDRMWNKVQGWMEQILSVEENEVLIKTVAQVVPTYSMSCFRLPRGLCQHIDSLLRSFWWGEQGWKEEDVLGGLRKLSHLFFQRKPSA
jgi:hypothetical protein